MSTSLPETYSNSGGYAAPPGYSLASNVATAQQYFSTHSLVDSLIWFRDQVKNGGPWDYKQQGAYEGLGNFNYGAVGIAVGLSDEFLKRMAGWAQGRAGTSDPAWGNWWGKPPYGDDPVDQQAITDGIDWSKNNFQIPDGIEIPNDLIKEWWKGLGQLIPDNLFLGGIDPTCNTLYRQSQRTSSPLILDLDGDGIEIIIPNNFSLS